MIDRVVIVAIRTGSSAENDRSAGGAGVYAAEGGVSECVATGFINEAHSHARGAGVGDGQLRGRPTATPSIAAHAAGPPVDGEELRAIQIHCGRRGVCAGDEQIGCACLGTKGKGVCRGGGEVAENERKGFDGAEVGWLEFQDQSASQGLGFYIRDGCSDARVVTASVPSPK